MIKAEKSEIILCGLPVLVEVHDLALLVGKVTPGCEAELPSALRENASFGSWREQLLEFDGAPLFPERIAYTVRPRTSAA
jgi:hypothetical protein